MTLKSITLFCVLFCIIPCKGNEISTNSMRKNSMINTKIITDSSKVFPLDYSNFTDKIQLEAPTDQTIKVLVKDKFQLWIDAMAKLPSNGEYDLYILNSVSGDSEMNYLVTINGTELIDGLEISNSHGNSSKTSVFSISENYEITIYAERNKVRKMTDKYYLNTTGFFINLLH